MKKLFTLALTTLLLVALAACGTDNEEENNGEADQGPKKIVVGATSVPHAEVLEQAVPLLEEQDIELEVEIYQDYVLPNQDLEDGILDANYFQHIPYFEGQKEEIGYDFVNLGGIHTEQLGIYSKDISSVDEVPEGTVVILSRSVADHGRVLSLLQDEGLIKIDENVTPADATIDDVVENPLNLEFDASIDAGLLPEYYNRETDALVSINANYAIEGGVNFEDAIILEEPDYTYTNIIAARSEDEDNEALKALVNVLQSDEIKSFMEEEYKGAVVPAKE
ncbi:D-methionine transport system substrate-binding protein [Gracilibacillus orientalis]|uniref:Lipoprotein n=1 Tax=Gracilibacillus orientalis TaxID=334253 RepID=A0A1I4RA34_9BACI|nr:MetQ/NlpA family ABC transporter substrate-binding protein [Gracilibacillus orientalis]SFM49055.1 D-methionine transport system substrate-binding protein [Gracilibacillus orientalis]